MLLSIGNRVKGDKLSFRLFMCSALYAFLFTSFSYESNLRASLMVKTYEPPIDSEMDLLERGGSFWLPRGTVLPLMYKTSKFPEQQALSKRMEERDTLFTFQRNGLYPRHVLEDILNNGGSGPLNVAMLLAQIDGAQKYQGLTGFR